MLRDGRFIKEPPPKIGSHYVPKFYQTVMDSNHVIEQETRWLNFYRKNLSSFEVGTWMVALYVFIAVLITVLRGMYNILFG